MGCLYKKKKDLWNETVHGGVAHVSTGEVSRMRSKPTREWYLVLKGQGILTPATTRMSREDSCAKWNQPGRERQTVRFHLYSFQFTGMESRRAISRGWEERGTGSFLKNCRFGFFHFSHSDLVVLESGTISFPKLRKLWSLEHWSRVAGAESHRTRWLPTAHLVWAQTALRDSPRADNRHFTVSYHWQQVCLEVSPFGDRGAIFKEKKFEFPEMTCILPCCFFSQRLTSVSAGHRNSRALLFLCTDWLKTAFLGCRLIEWNYAPPRGTKAKPGDFCKEATLVKLRLLPVMTCIDEFCRHLWMTPS